MTQKKKTKLPKNTMSAANKAIAEKSVSDAFPGMTIDWTLIVEDMEIDDSPLTLQWIAVYVEAMTRPNGRKHHWIVPADTKVA